MQLGDLPAAKEMFSRSLINARLGGAEPSDEALIQLKLARIDGNLCHHNEAEKLFVEAITNLKKDNSDPGYTFIARLDFSQFLFDIGKYDKAIPRYEVIINEAKELFGDSDPLSVAVLYDDLVYAYEQIGDTEKAELARKESKNIRNNNTGFTEPTIIKSKENYKPYPKTC